MAYITINYFSVENCQAFIDIQRMSSTPINISSWSNVKFVAKQKKTVEERRLEATRIKKKYANRCPIICEYFSYKDTDQGKLDKNKFLVPRDMTVASFMQIVRRRMKIGAHDALYIFTAIGLPRSSMTIAELYDVAADEDEFLYMAIRPEKTFGTHQ